MSHLQGQYCCTNQTLLPFQVLHTNIELQHLQTANNSLPNNIHSCSCCFCYYLKYNFIIEHMLYEWTLSEWNHKIPSFIEHHLPCHFYCISPLMGARMGQSANRCREYRKTNIEERGSHSSLSLIFLNECLMHSNHDPGVIRALSDFVWMR